MRLSTIGASGNCFHCGNEVTQGGFWSSEQDVYLCSDDACIRGLMHLAIDTLKDSVFMGTASPHIGPYLKDIVKESVREKKISDEYNY